MRVNIDPHTSCPRCHGDLTVTSQGLHCPGCDWKEWVKSAGCLMPPVAVMHWTATVSIPSKFGHLNLTPVRVISCSIGPDAQGQHQLTTFELN